MLCLVAFAQPDHLIIFHTSFFHTPVGASLLSSVTVPCWLSSPSFSSLFYLPFCIFPSTSSDLTHVPTSWFFLPTMHFNNFSQFFQHHFVFLLTSVYLTFSILLQVHIWFPFPISIGLSLCSILQWGVILNKFIKDIKPTASL